MKKLRYIIKKKKSKSVEGIYRARIQKVIDLNKVIQRGRVNKFEAIESFFNFNINYNTLSTSLELKLLFFFQVWHQTFGKITVFEHLRELGCFGTKIITTKKVKDESRR